MPEGTNLETPVSEQLHESAAVNTGDLNGAMGLSPSLLNFQSAALHSSQGSMTKMNNSGAFGFGHVKPVDDLLAFPGLAFAYIIVLGSVIGSAVKRNISLNLRELA